MILIGGTSIFLFLNFIFIKDIFNYKYFSTHKFDRLFSSIPVAIGQGLMQFVLNDVCASISSQALIEKLTLSTSIQVRSGLLSAKKEKGIFVLFPFLTFKQVN